MPASLKNQFISDLYTSLLHLSGAQLGPSLNRVFDGAGNSTGLALSGKRVVINNYIYPKGFDPHARAPMEWLDAFFPVGSLQLTFDEIDPNLRIAGTTWDLVSQGRFLVGVGTYKDQNGDQYTFCPGEPPEANEGGNKAGEYRHTLTVGEIPAHWHTTNTGTTQVQIPSDVGTGPNYNGAPAGTENSNPGFAEQQQRRNILAARINWNLDNEYGYNTRSEGLAEVKRGFDLNFYNGSAKNYTTQEKSTFLDDENWNFKEMIGIWNGETRFIASRTAGTRNIPLRSSQSSLRNVNWYDFCLRLGCVDVTPTSPTVSGIDNETSFVTGDENTAGRQEGAHNNRDSDSVGLGLPHNNIPPSYGVYVWRRIA